MSQRQPLPAKGTIKPEAATKIGNLRQITALSTTQIDAKIILQLKFTVHEIQYCSIKHSSIKANTVIRMKATLKDFPKECEQLRQEGFLAQLVHQDGLMLDVNEEAARIVGLRVEDMVGTRSWRFYNPAELVKVQENMLTHEDVSYEVGAVNAQGEKFRIHLKVLALNFDGEAYRLAAYKKI